MKFKNVVILYLGLFLIINLVYANNIGTSEWNVNTDENGKIIESNQKDYSIAEFNVIANISSTQLWAEVNLSTEEINFGNVERGNYTTIDYKIWARGNLDINVKPEISNKADNIFSKYLFFSRTPSSGFDDKEKSKIGSYTMRFNLTANPGKWLAIGPSDMENKTNSNGKQYIRLDLREFKEIIPFEELHQNKVKFVITPIWSSIEP